MWIELDMHTWITQPIRRCSSILHNLNGYEELRNVVITFQRCYDRSAGEVPSVFIPDTFIWSRQMRSMQECVCVCACVCLIFVINICNHILRQILNYNIITALCLCIALQINVQI